MKDWILYITNIVGKVADGLVDHLTRIHLSSREEVGTLLQLVDDGDILYQVREAQCLSETSI